MVDNNQNLIAWNTRYVEMFNYPDSLMRIGTPILNILQHNVENGHLRDLDPEIEIKTRFQHFVRGTPFSVERKLDNGKFIRIFGNLSQMVALSPATPTLPNSKQSKNN